VREEAPELLVELGGEGLVVRHHQGRAIHRGDDRGHRERLARAGDAEQDLVLVAARQAVNELRHRVHLIAAEFEVGNELKAVMMGRHLGSAQKPPSYHAAAAKLFPEGGEIAFAAAHPHVPP
jgi:L-asparaginase II